MDAIVYLLLGLPAGIALGTLINILVVLNRIADPLTRENGP